MNLHVLTLLEFPKVCQLVADRTHSPRGRELALSLHPGSDRNAVLADLDLVLQMRDLWIAGLDPGPIEVADLDAHLGRLRLEGNLLEPADLMILGRFLALSTRVRRSLVTDGVLERFPSLYALGSEFADFSVIVRRLDEVFDPGGDFLDTASPELLRIRRRLRDQRTETGEALASLARRSSTHPDESFVTLRDGRYVLAVRAQDRGRIPGVVHGHSGSGQTVFLEPLSVMDRNNSIAELESEEQLEKIRILREICDALHSRVADIARGYASSARLDLVRARAEFAIDLDGRAPSFSDDGALRLVGARHPLLAETQRRGGPAVVPLDLAIEGPARTLVISGPNMGGKTVALKTIGLLAAMAHAAIPVPVGEGTALPWLDGIFADIGDEQSIEQETSTFAGHLRNIALAWAQGTRDSLVLLDELGGGTDPDEGTALGRALLELLTERGALLVATTHLLGLKMLAHEHSGMVNAAMEFDPSTQRPTYRMQTGSPGRSRAFELARRILPPGDLLERAESYRSRLTAELDELLGDLERQRRAVEEERKRLVMREEDLARTTEWRNRQADRLKARLHALRSARLEAAGREIAQAELALAEARRLRADLEREARRSVRDGSRGIPQAEEIRAIEGKIASARRALRVPQQPGLRPLAPDAIAPGRMAYSADLKADVRIESYPDGADRVSIAHGAFRFVVPVKGLFAAGGGATAEPPRRRSTVRTPAEPLAVPREIDLRGRTAEEGLLETERYIDQAALAGVPEVRIIHGKGTGRLKRAIEEFLSRSPLVESFRIGEPREGGWGATIIRIRSASID